MWKKRDHRYNQTMNTIWRVAEDYDRAVQKRKQKRQLPGEGERVSMRNSETKRISACRTMALNAMTETEAGDDLKKAQNHYLSIEFFHLLIGIKFEQKFSMLAHAFTRTRKQWIKILESAKWKMQES